jgi:hypothetical protein
MLLLGLCSQLSAPLLLQLVSALYRGLRGALLECLHGTSSGHSGRRRSKAHAAARKAQAAGVLQQPGGSDSGSGTSRRAPAQPAPAGAAGLAQAAAARRAALMASAQRIRALLQQLAQAGPSAAAGFEGMADHPVLVAAASGACIGQPGAPAAPAAACLQASLLVRLSDRPHDLPFEQRATRLERRVLQAVQEFASDRGLAMVACSAVCVRGSLVLLAQALLAPRNRQAPAAAAPAEAPAEAAAAAAGGPQPPATGRAAAPAGAHAAALDGAAAQELCARVTAQLQDEAQSAAVRVEVSAGGSGPCAAATQGLAPAAAATWQRTSPPGAALHCCLYPPCILMDAAPEAAAGEPGGAGVRQAAAAACGQQQPGASAGPAPGACESDQHAGLPPDERECDWEDWEDSEDGEGSWGPGGPSRRAAMWAHVALAPGEPRPQGEGGGAPAGRGAHRPDAAGGRRPRGIRGSLPLPPRPLACRCRRGLPPLLHKLPTARRPLPHRCCPAPPLQATPTPYGVLVKAAVPVAQLQQGLVSVQVRSRRASSHAAHAALRAAPAPLQRRAECMHAHRSGPPRRRAAARSSEPGKPPPAPPGSSASQAGPALPSGAAGAAGAAQQAVPGGPAAGHAASPRVAQPGRGLSAGGAAAGHAAPRGVAGRDRHHAAAGGARVPGPTGAATAADGRAAAAQAQAAAAGRVRCAGGAGHHRRLPAGPAHAGLPGAAAGHHQHAAGRQRERRRQRRQRSGRGGAGAAAAAAQLPGRAGG